VTGNAEIIATVLEACTGDAYKMSGILAHEKIVPLVGMDSVSRVQGVIRALAIVGWLYRRGRTNSAWYQTTAFGRAQFKELRAA